MRVILWLQQGRLASWLFSTAETATCPSPAGASKGHEGTTWTANSHQGKLQESNIGPGRWSLCIPPRLARVLSYPDPSVALTAQGLTLRTALTPGQKGSGSRLLFRPIRCLSSTPTNRLRVYL